MREGRIACCILAAISPRSLLISSALFADDVYAEAVRVSQMLTNERPTSLPGNDADFLQLFLQSQDFKLLAKVGDDGVVAASWLCG
jgi:hypothetical protein